MMSMSIAGVFLVSSPVLIASGYWLIHLSMMVGVARMSLPAHDWRCLAVNRQWLIATGQEKLAAGGCTIAALPKRLDLR
jgi:hypothetical protein